MEEKSRAPEFYGFTAWVGTWLGFVLFVLWAFVPEQWIEWVGITWYPSREWSLLIPAWTMVVVLLTYWTYFALALLHTPPFDSACTVTDSQASMDVDIRCVNRALYRKKKGNEDPLESECVNHPWAPGPDSPHDIYSSTL